MHKWGKQAHQPGRVFAQAVRDPHKEIKAVSELSDLLHQLETDRFYGSLEVKFEAGRVTLIRRTETINPRARDASRNHREDRGYADDHEH